MDNFTYQYNGITNRLDHVDDSVAMFSNSNDLNDQDVGNYEYNSIGQLVKNNQDNIEYIYNASGLVTQIKQDGNVKMNILYDDKGKRFKKETNIENVWHETYYVRDASGPVMAIYNGTYGGLIAPIKAEEYPIYGASRLGIERRAPNGLFTSSQYRFTDHLGNVRAVVNNSQVITNYADYFPGGMAMPERNVEGDYRYKYQGQEKDPETGMEAFELRLWDARVGS